MPDRLIANTGQVTFDLETFFGVELVAPAGQIYDGDNADVIYAFNEEELTDLFNLLRFAKIRSLVNEVTTTTYEDSGGD